MKRKIMLLFFVMISLIMCGCSPSSDDSSNTDSTSSKYGDSEISLSEAFSTDSDTVWYYCSVDSNDVGKDTPINRVFIFQDGELSVCEKVFETEDDELYGLSLGDVAKMSDEEVITMVKTAEEKKKSDEFTEIMNNAKKGCDYLFSQGIFDKAYEYNGNTYDLSSMKVIYEKLSKSLENYKYIEEPENYGIAIYSDNTGNTTDSETIAYTRRALDPFYGSIASFSYEEHYPKQLDSDRLNMFYDRMKGTFSDSDIVSKYITIDSLHTNDYIYITGELEPSPGAIVIYETNYDGYSANAVSYGSAYLPGVLLTKSSGKRYVLDVVGTKGIIVDPPDKSDILGEQTNAN